MRIVRRMLMLAVVSPDRCGSVARPLVNRNAKGRGRALQRSLESGRQDHSLVARKQESNNSRASRVVRKGEWRAFYRDAGYAGAEEDFFNDELRAHIIDAADRNTENNDARSSLLYWARVWLFWLLGCSTVAGVAYIANHVRFHG